MYKVGDIIVVHDQGSVRRDDIFVCEIFTTFSNYDGYPYFCKVISTIQCKNKKDNRLAIYARCCESVEEGDEQIQGLNIKETDLCLWAGNSIIIGEKKLADELLYKAIIKDMKNEFKALP